MQSSNVRLQEKLDLLEKKFDAFHHEATTCTSSSQPHPPRKKLSPPLEVRVGLFSLLYHLPYSGSMDPGVEMPIT